MSKQYIYFKKYKARNAIFGAIIGDSLGSTLEFQKTKNAKMLVSKYSNFENGLVGSLKIYANACICIYFNEAFHCALQCKAQ